MSKESLKLVIIRVGNKYLDSSTSKGLRITIGEILLGKIELDYEKNKKSDE
ncbi:hypothetical protein B0P06_002205 [Clostridium saccharoperbutylacetonicum]|uniref:Uncharacterized protein n=1 Tax=Clostridium saccharoperbutylacetonicum N1-4(HMT) TaxID=931276 RepID=M1MY48_9CLOT|nr:hypothetical protein [Clostridium saccharoperbutylacetonicum]AGF59456.1 hypothetical protein Cspa_c57310 [Clostridium saccharoperbutylacetonicum N1-4(HMT)]NRT59751.1 hypothetical protein [Clostridium saccharoperbutylacetonicum]NSB23063.1 hypothetical protein [Clostridium saccharoperbutylacetonicum]NSB42434.1 hypothetical protein [Clostridium saccharoperbutylacetonicum]